MAKKWDGSKVIKEIDAVVDGCHCAVPDQHPQQVVSSSPGLNWSGLASAGTLAGTRLTFCPARA